MTVSRHMTLATKRHQLTGFRSLESASWSCGPNRNRVSDPRDPCHDCSTADSQTAVSPKPAGAHTQAAALLSRPHTPVTMKLERSSSVSETAMDAHASAAALLSGHRIARQATVVSAVREPSYGQTPADAQLQAAALLSGTRTAAGSLPSRPAHGVPAAVMSF